MSTAPKAPISGLPLLPRENSLIHNLTPDPAASSVPAFRDLLANKPSTQRRSRLAAPSAHFAFVSPFPAPFPYDITPPTDGSVVTDKSAYIETWLAAREAVYPRETASQGPLQLLYPENRDQPRELIGLAPAGLRDCLPGLDVGDAFAVLGAPTLAHEFDEEDEPLAASAEDQAARQELVDVLSGHAMLMSHPDADASHAPWALRYSGHQFGSWAGQLGDGRAISLLEVPHPEDPNMSWEIQLKGAGRTPFSRTADGLAVLRSSIREFLCAEAIHALGIPTTRSLTLIHLPALSVEREKTESACVLARLAPSFLRVGCFEALSPPADNLFFFGGGQQKRDPDALLALGSWVARRVLRLPEAPPRHADRFRTKMKALLTFGHSDRDSGELPARGGAWGKELVLECAHRNARMVAGWQAYGWMHGVINTDNVSILGLTIDYGPYAFMDVFDPLHICNHSDDGGRYAYVRQPSMILYAMRALLSALAPLIGAEAEAGGALTKGWGDKADDRHFDMWARSGKELVSDELDRVVTETCATEYARLMHKRLGLSRLEADDEATFMRPLLDLMRDHALDFHRTFRALCFFQPSSTPSPSPYDAFITDALLVNAPEPARLDRERATADWRVWLAKYAARIENEGAEPEERRRAMLAANPRFVLRQWLLEEVIKRVERDTDSGKRVLAKVLQMACAPFEPWGAEGKLDGELSKEEQEERRFCGMGERKMLGFQCSCSS